MNAQELGGHVFAIHGIRMSKHGVKKLVIDEAAKGLEKSSDYRLTEVEPELFECQRSDGKRLYTKDDLWQLLGKMARVIHLGDSSNLLSIFATHDKRKKLIEEFETRFQCKFADALKLFPNVNVYGICRGSDDYAYRRYDGKRVG